MRVLLATDGSRNAQDAAAWLATFPLPADATVRVVTVAPAAPVALAALGRDEALAVANAACAALAPHVRAVEACARQGDAREELVRAAQDWPADLVVLGARGLGAVAGLLLGSVSLAVAQHAPCPVLVVPHGARPVLGVLVAVDGSEAAQRAASFAAALPLAPGVAIHLLAVVERPRYPSTAPAAAAGLLRAAIDDTIAERTAALERALAQAAAAFGERALQRLLVVGHPAEEIVRAADGHRVDLVVVGARGLGAVKRLLLGSVSEAVLRDAQRAVLVVRGG
jgi:nucleotide-binding universal stress UspA family protein